MESDGVAADQTLGFSKPGFLNFLGPCRVIQDEGLVSMSSYTYRWRHAPVFISLYEQSETRPLYVHLS
jgi:hypothetical protein